MQFALHVFDCALLQNKGLWSSLPSVIKYVFRFPYPARLRMQQEGFNCLAYQRCNPPIDPLSLVVTL
jgi:hypothetical protein